MSYPSLAANIHMANLEIRAGRTMTEALEHLGDRLGLDEARSFATLIQQSDELGSSISDALRVYSDDMRHKRLSRAEEKAYSLPAKLAVPMMVCIFPVLFVVILCPVIVRVGDRHVVTAVAAGSDLALVKADGSERAADRPWGRRVLKPRPLRTHPLAGSGQKVP